MTELLKKPAFQGTKQTETKTMNTTKKSFKWAWAIAFIFAVLPCMAQTTPPLPTTPPPTFIPPPPPTTSSLSVSNGITDPFTAMLNILPSWNPSLTNTFGAGEMFFGATPLWKSQTASGSTPYLSTFGGYMFTKNFGAEAELQSFGDGSGGSSIDSFAAHAIARKDVGNVAGFLYTGPCYDTHAAKFGLDVGGGIEYRYSTRIGLQVDTRWRELFHGAAFSGFETRVGPKFTF